MPSIAAKPRVTSLAPQFLVDDLQRAIAYYRDALLRHRPAGWRGEGKRGHPEYSCVRRDQVASTANILDVPFLVRARFALPVSLGGATHAKTEKWDIQNKRYCAACAPAR